ncbi:MAG: hypothetical protein FJX57_11750 [Alphaproteobacteria bacterium]|nr:hypothetical protein [Alphaproteobacteria bacterium]
MSFAGLARVLGATVFGIAAVHVGYDTARTILDVDPTAPVEMRVEQVVERGRWPIEWRAVGWPPDEASRKNVRVYDEDPLALRLGDLALP